MPSTADRVALRPRHSNRGDESTSAPAGVQAPAILTVRGGRAGGSVVREARAASFCGAMTVTMGRMKPLKSVPAELAKVLTRQKLSAGQWLAQSGGALSLSEGQHGIASIAPFAAPVAPNPAFAGLTKADRIPVAMNSARIKLCARSRSFITTKCHAGIGMALQNFVSGGPKAVPNLTPRDVGRHPSRSR